MLTIYKASAGSGKTFTLALEYIKLLLGIKGEDGKYYLNSRHYAPDGCRTPNRHRGILAVTFTNKATEEMKTRIIKEIDALKHIPALPKDDSPYAQKLIDTFHCSREELAEAAGYALTELLTDYMHFNVSTIDSFFQMVLRTFAREVDRQGDYEIELNDRMAFNIGVGLMLDDLNYGATDENSRMHNWINGFTSRKIDDSKSFNIFNRTSNVLSSLTGYVNAISSEQFKEFADRTLEYLECDPNLTNFRKELTDCIDSLLTDAAKAASSALEDWKLEGYDNAALPAIVMELLTKANNSEAIDITRFNTASAKYAMDPGALNDRAKLYVKKYCPTVKKEHILPPEYLDERIKEALLTIYDTTFKVTICREVLDACDGLEFIGFTWKYIDQFRKENNLILLSDTNDLIYRIIKNSDMPFIYERLGVMLTNFLIDEFQDTSHMQWRNLKPLVANSLDDQHDNLIIGDEKQAIYRFRNSDSSMLHYSVANVDFPTQHVIKGARPGENTNYRSASGIVLFNNSVFKRIAALDDLHVYDNVAQTLKPRSAEEEALMTSYITITDVANVEQDEHGYEASYKLTAEGILRQHDAGYKWKDIVVLVRKRSDAVNIINYFMEYYPEIQLASEEALMLTNSQAVRLIVSLLKLLDVSYQADNAGPNVEAGEYGSMQDTLLMISRFEYHMGNLHHDSAVANTPTDALLAALNPDATATSSIYDEIKEIRDKKPSNLISLVETIIELRIPPEQRAREFAYIAAFQDLVIDYCSRNNPSIHSFTTWWDDNKDKLAVNASAESDAVNIMTVHKAKGLEWDCVHIPFAAWELTKTDASLWVDLKPMEEFGIEQHPPVIYLKSSKALNSEESPLRFQISADLVAQLVDNINTAYVALTRPARELNICYNSNSSKFSSSFGAKLLEALKLPHRDPDGHPELYMDLSEYFDEQTNSFAYGEPTIPLPKKKTSSPLCTRAVPEYVVVHRADTSKLTTIEDAVSLKSSLDIGNDEDKAPTKEESQVKEVKITDEELNRRTQRGLWLHNVLADMTRLDDLDQAMQRMNARQPLDDDIFEEYHQNLVEAFERIPSYRDRWFVEPHDILTESAIYDPDYDKVLRPDRLVFFDDGSVEIVDYKFTSGELAGHVAQVTSYVNLLRQMGYDSVSGYLWYPLKGEVVKV
jgi:ATP-dependent exoDNAse (exonuclease V) beta subunit